MIRLLVIEVDTEKTETWNCGQCKYSTPPFCELFQQSSNLHSDGNMDRVNDCFTAERRYIDPVHRQFDLEKYEHPRNRKFKK